MKDQPKTGIKRLIWNGQGTRLLGVYYDGNVQEMLLIEDGIPHATLRATVDIKGDRLSVGVQDVAFSPGGRFAAYALGNGAVSILDLLTRKLCLSYDRHAELFPAWPLAVAWSADGKRIASGGTDRSLRIWEAETGAPIISHSGYSGELGHKGDIVCIAWSPDGQRVASGSRDGTVIVASVDQKDGNLYRAHEGEVSSLLWAPDGTFLASSGMDGTVRVWDTSTHQVLHVYQEHTAGVTDLASSPDGIYLASSSEDQSVHIWQALTGERVVKYEENYAVRALAWSPKGLLVYEGPQDTLRIVFLRLPEPVAPAEAMPS